MVNKNNILEEKLTPKDRLRIILTPEDFKDYERMVEESEGIISWEKLEEYSEFDENQNLIGIYWKGDLDLSSTKITSLGNLNKVWGDLDLRWVPITSLGSLNKIWGNLNLIWTPIKSLSNLNEVWGDLDLYWTPLTSLSNLNEVWGDLNLRLTPITNLGELQKVWGDLDLYWTPLTSLSNLNEVWGDLYLSWTSITNLGELQKVWGELHLSWTPLISLSNLNEVWGNLRLSQTPIESLGNLNKVWGNLKLGLTPIESLGNLNEVWGNLDLDQTDITSLGNLNKVWGNLNLRWLSRKNIINIRKEIRNKKIHIWGEINYDWEDIYEEFSTFFDYLWKFDDDANLDNSKIEKEKQEFIKKYWTNKTKKSDSVKKDLNLTANIFFYFLVDNFIEEWDKTKNQIEELKKSSKDKKSIKKEKLNLKLALDNKIEEKFSEISHYFWEEIKKRLEDEFKREMMIDKNNIPEEKLTPKDRLKKILTPEDFKNYERMVKESYGRITWRRLEEYSEFDENQKLKGIYRKNNFNLYWIKITSLGNLKYVWGELNLSWSSITSLGNLEEVWEDLYLRWVPITSLGNLKKVWGELNLKLVPRKNIINIRKEIRNKKIHIWKEIICYDRSNIYQEFSTFFNYLWEFNNDESLDNSKIEESKKKFINKYWYGSAKRSDSVKKDLNLIANIFYYFIVDNFIEEWEKIKKIIKELKKSNKNEKSIKEEKLNLRLTLHNKLEEKFSEINNYFWEDIKKRLEDEFKKEMEGYGNHK